MDKHALHTQGHATHFQPPHKHSSEEVRGGSAGWVCLARWHLRLNRSPVTGPSHTHMARQSGGSSSLCAQASTTNVPWYSPLQPPLEKHERWKWKPPQSSHLQQMIGIRGCSAMKMPTRPWLIIGGLSQERWRRWKRVMQSSWQRTSSWNRIRQSSWQRWSAWRRLCRLWHGMLPARNLKSSRLASPVVASKALASPALALALIRHTNQKDHHTNEGSRARLMPHCLSAAAVTPQHSSLTVTRRETLPAERKWRQAGPQEPGAPRNNGLCQRPPWMAPSPRS